tara:strand:- start:24088 stop:24741 length:654 start_codon:yes stop_codon:yes gene_type:complete
MLICARIALFFIFVCLSACDGPNGTTDAKTSNSGAHNDDGFQVSFKVNNGASITSELVVALQFSVSGVDEMYITQESACNIGGTWEPYKTFKQWTLQKSNDMNFFYLKVRKGNHVSDCHFASIEHDATVPSFQLVTPADNSTLVNANQLSLAGTCSEDSVITIVINSVAATTASCTGGVWGKLIDVTLLPSGSFSVQVKATDLVANNSPVQNFTFIK